LTTDIGIDLGTSSVLVYVKDKGIVLREPSVVAIDNNTNKIVRIGKEAQQMLGRAPENISIIRPLKDGVISQYSVTLKMLQYFIHRACGNTIIRPRVMICVPSGINEAEEMTVINATNQAGARQTLLIEEPVAAAIGAGIDISAPSGNMVVDIGGGTTDIAVISLEGVVVSESIKVAGDKFDEAIIRYVRQKYNILIGERTAESIKIRLGTVFKPTRLEQMDVKGRCLAQGLPKYVTLNNYEMLEALLGPITAIIDAICQVIERTPPELVADIINNGIVMTGGGSLLRGFDKLITDLTGIHTYVAKDAISCVAIGTGKALDHINILSERSLNFTRAQKRSNR
jgi:rod shape-determining protein MreB